MCFYTKLSLFINVSLVRQSVHICRFLAFERRSDSSYEHPPSKESPFCEYFEAKHWIGSNENLDCGKDTPYMVSV